MTRRSLLTATMIALAMTIIPVARDAEATLGVGLSTAACAEGGCGYWNPLMDCLCPDLQIPNYTPRCA
ncbi:hypothetical protein [Candidatus Palauibacter sp.]|uniref:hypothetical protein n=1 Tax=Candidatus Palauibacter sp. TaxID=3101350 RepID=UPI003B51E9D8